MKIRPVGVELFQADGRADRQTDRQDEANSRFSRFCERALELLVMSVCKKMNIMPRN